MSNSRVIRIRKRSFEILEALRKERIKITNDNVSIAENIDKITEEYYNLKKTLNKK